MISLSQRNYSKKQFTNDFIVWEWKKNPLQNNRLNQTYLYTLLMQQNHELTDEVRVSQAEQGDQLLPPSIAQYRLGKTLGKGTFGKVKQAIHIPTSQKVAIKIIDKNTIQDQDDKERILREVEIMKTVRHPNIIHLYQIIETDTLIYLVLEYAEQGELFKLMSNQGRLKQRAAGRIFLQVLNAVEYLHRLDIVHRDLKPQNILLDVDFNIKLIDYGLSNYHQQGKKLSTACGSPCYAPPQMLSGNDYDGKVGDVWSLGIIFYGMVCGALPFEEQNTKELYKRVIEGFYYIPNDISIQAIEVIQKMLVTDPKKRITIPEIRKLRYFKEIHKIQPQIIGIIVGYHPMPIDNQILEKMASLCPKPKHQIEYMIKENQHNQFTTIYYLIQKQILRDGGKTVVDLQIFLETHQRYSKEYGKQSLEKYFKQLGVGLKISTKSEQKRKQAKSGSITPRKTQGNLTDRKTLQKSTISKADHNKIERKGLSKQKYNKNEFKQENPLKFFSNQRINTNNRKLLSSLDSKNLKKLTKTPNKTQERYTISSLSKNQTQTLHHSQRPQNLQRPQTINTARSHISEKERPYEKIERVETERKERSKSRSVSKVKKLKLKSPSKNLAINLWNAYFMDPLEKKVDKEKKRKVNPKEQQKIQAFDMNVKKLKEGFLHLPQMQRTKKIRLKKDSSQIQRDTLQNTKKLKKFNTTVSDI